MELIQVVDITKTYKTEEKETQVLKHFSYGFPNKGLFGVIGKSGSGKSTLLNMVSLLDKPTSGDIYFNNENMLKWSNKRKIRFRNKEMGIIFQHYHLVESESVIYNIALPYLISGGSEKEGKAKNEFSEESSHSCRWIRNKIFTSNEGFTKGNASYC